MNDDLAAVKARLKPKQLKPLDMPRQFLSAAFSPCGCFFLAGGMEGQLCRWYVVADTPEPELIALSPLTGLTAWVSACICLPDGLNVVAADSFGSLASWRYCSESPEPSWRVANAHDGWVRGLDTSADGQAIATCGRDGFVRLWSLDAQNRGEIKLGGDLSVVRFHPDGKSLFVGSLEGRVSQWDVATSVKLRDFDASPLFMVSRLQDTGGVRTLALSPDGATLLVGGTQPSVGGNVQGKPTVLAFEVTSGTLKRKGVLGADGDVYVTDLEWHPDGCWLVSTSGNPGQGKLVLWRVEDEQPLFESKLSNCHAVRRHPSGNWFVLLTTNANSNGNGKVVDKSGEYLGNRSPLQLFGFAPQHS